MMEAPNYGIGSSDCFVVTDTTETQLCQNKLDTAFKDAGKPVRISTGTRGMHRIPAYWIKEYGFWYARDVRKSWNEFGIVENESKLRGHNNSIVCRINPPLQENNRRSYGRFVKDDNGRYYIAHTGYFRRKGMKISIDNFPMWPKGRVCDQDYSVLLISAFDDKDLIGNLNCFVRTVSVLKDTKGAISS